MDGMEKMANALKKLRNNPPKAAAGSPVVKVSDYLTSVTTDILNGKKEKILLPKSDVLCYEFENKAEVIVRPSGTEPKIKFYVEVKGEMGCAKCYSSAEAAAKEKVEAVKKSLGI